MKKPEIKFSDAIKPDEPALITNLVSRRLAQPFARLAYTLGMSANAVTVLAGLCWILSTPLAVLAGAAACYEKHTLSLALWFTCGVLWNLGYILDLADGSLARMTHTDSARGFYLDYVFHLLFKPAFLASVGIGLALPLALPLQLPLLLLAILSIPANWSASASAAEHVLCEKTGKGSPLSADSPEAHRSLWLGLTDITESAAQKKQSPLRFIRTICAEILSYYGQFSFFSLLVLLDILLQLSLPDTLPRRLLPFTTVGFVFFSLFFIARIPQRVIRDFKRFGNR